MRDFIKSLGEVKKSDKNIETPFIEEVDAGFKCEYRMTRALV